jgi:hypothetical protein
VISSRLSRGTLALFLFIGSKRRDNNVGNERVRIRATNLGGDEVGSNNVGDAMKFLAGAGV